MENQIKEVVAVIGHGCKPGLQQAAWWQRRDAKLELILMELRMGTRYQRGTIEDHIDWQVGA